MFKTTHIMKEEKFPIAGCQSIQGAFNGYAVNNASLRPIQRAKTAPNMFLRDVCHHLLE